MKKLLGMLLLVLFGVTLFGCEDVYGQETVYNDETLSSFIDFNLKTVDEVATEENFLFSPLSLYYAMSILYSFSSDTAETELSELFGITKDELSDQIDILSQSLPISDEYSDFAAGNFVYYDNSANDYKEDGLMQYQSVFQYELDEIDFPSGDAARQLIERICEVTDGFLNPTEDDFEFLKDASFLINNTIYYRGTWHTVYKEDSTEDKTFHALDGTEQTVSMMTKRTSSTKYYESKKATAVQDFFKDGSSMIFILPDEGMSIKELLNNHNEMKKLLQPDMYFDFEPVEITIPKFTFEKTTPLKEPLQNLGMSSIWTPTRTNFSLISNSDFFIDDIFQMAKIQVDEVGVKVAASTTIIGATSAGPVEYIEFTVDRPFLYIVLSPENIPLFYGSIVSF